MKSHQKQNVWIVVAILAGSVIALTGAVFGLVKALQAIMTNARYRALEKSFHEKDSDLDALILSACGDLPLTDRTDGIAS